MNKSIDPTTNRSGMLLPWILGGLGILVILGAFLAYYLNIGQFHPISNQQTVWAEFGDFVGGVANPFIALLALIGLLVTIRMQQREFQDVKESMQTQVNIARSQARNESLSNLMQMFLSKIEDIEKWTFDTSDGSRFTTSAGNESNIIDDGKRVFTLADDYQKYLLTPFYFNDLSPLLRHLHISCFEPVQQIYRLSRNALEILNQFSTSEEQQTSNPMHEFYKDQVTTRLDFLSIAFPDFIDRYHSRLKAEPQKNGPTK